MALSPMMKQYLETKEKNPDCLLMFRLGDFYEMFFEDAVTASKELELVLTGKNCGLEERAPMCGVPYHAVDGYVAQAGGKRLQGRDMRAAFRSEKRSGRTRSRARGDARHRNGKRAARSG